jgi:hypothetical protein
MLAVGAVGTFFAMSSGRRYIALHSDSQVDAHLQSSARVSGGVRQFGLPSFAC